MSDTCTHRDCDKPARAAIRTTRPSREDVRVLLYADDRCAPKTATRYCQEHAIHLMAELTKVLVDGDD